MTKGVDSWLTFFIMITMALHSTSCQSIQDYNLDVRDEVESYEKTETSESSPSQRSRDGYALFLNIVRLPLFAALGALTVLAKVFGGAP